ncbi:MAG: 50S ribosomal protein L31 [Verrucomicrobiota bacterium]
MKTDIHPEYHQTTLSCTCGKVFHTRSTVENIRISICADCHPFFTGEQKLVDTAGRVEKYQQRYGASKARRSRPKLSS